MKKYVKPMAIKGGHGYVTSYRLSVGSEEARECGFVDADGKQSLVEKIVDPGNGQVIFRRVDEASL